MGWIPCSGNSGTKKKIVKMEVQDSVAPQIKATPGIVIFLLFVYGFDLCYPIVNN